MSTIKKKGLGRGLEALLGSPAEIVGRPGRRARRRC